MESAVAMDGTEPKRKRHVIVVKKIEQKSPKKPVYVSRKVRDASELAEMEESLLGATSPQHPIHEKDGSIQPRSILGDPKYFEMIENAPEGDENAIKPASPPKSTMSRASSRRSLMSTGSLLSKKSRTPKEPTVIDPSANPELYISTLETMKLKAAKARVKEQEKEATIINFLPVNERFNLNKEGKVLTRWQERQKQWEGIQNNLASRLGGTKESLLMSTLDEYRGRNEEYDVLQAAIPPHERFGAHSWQMLLRGGGERSVAVGHIFSGLTCNIAIKERVPPMLRKPRAVGTAPKRDTFVDPTPSLLAKRKHLNKTLTVIRPHNIGPDLVEGLVISGIDMFDWAISSSKEFAARTPSVTIAPTPTTAATAKNTQINAGFDMKPGNDSPLAGGSFVDAGPKLSFLSSRNVVFNNLVGDVTHQVLSFKNTGTAALNYVWREVPDRSSNPISAVLAEHAELPREHDIAKARPHFYCQRPKGYILPGETIDTVFSFSSKGVGGYFSQNWLLDTVPKAGISFPNQHPSTSLATKSSPRAGSTGPANAVHSTVSIKLRGFAATVDNMQHRRTAISASLDTAALKTSTTDEIYECMRRVRQPVTVDMLNTRKINLFKSINFDILQRFCSQLVDENEVFLSINRLNAIVELAHVIGQFCVDMTAKHEDVQQRAQQLLCAEQESHYDLTAEEQEARRLKEIAVKRMLLPEKTLEPFDEIDDNMLDMGWDMDIAFLLSDLDTAYEACSSIAANESHIAEVLKQQEKERIKAEKLALKAARRQNDSDAEDEEEEEEEEETDEDAAEGAAATPVVLHADVNACKNLILTLRNALLELALPMTSTSLVSDIYSNLCTVFDAAENMSGQIRQDLGIPMETILGPIPSAYSDEVGIELWSEVLSAPAETGGKKAPPAKGKSEGVTDEQRKKYIAQLYHEFYKKIVDTMETVLVSADEALENCAVTSDKYSDIDQFASVRQEDLNGANIVFMSIDADVFSMHPQRSAYDAKAVAQTKVALQIWNLVEGGAARIVLLCESTSDVYGESFASAVDDVVCAIGRYKATLPEKVQRKSIASKRQYKCSGCVNIAELQFNLRNSVANEDIVEIFLVNNLQANDIVPADVAYEEPVSDDEDGPITIGLAEKRATDLNAWQNAPPRKRDVQVAGSNAPESISVDVADALSELVHRYNAIWVENSASTLCNPPQNKHLNRVTAASNRLLSLELREAAVWCALLKHSSSPKFLEGNHGDASSATSLEEYYTHLYPSIAASPTQVIRTHAVVGGALSIEKLRLLDRLCDVVSTIIVVGEVALPFIACSRRIVFPAHESLYGIYIQSCTAVLKKSKCRGVRLILPVDAIMGDENVTAELRDKPSLSFDKDARDEGADYDGESKPLALPTGPSDANNNWPHVSGHFFDIGPETCNLLRSEIATSDMLLSWGTVGCCEVSSFQSGQRALVTSILQRNGITADSKLSPKPLHCIVLGDANVEWWERFSDPEGEMAGDLVRIGVASFASRVSAGFVGILSNLPSPTLQRITRRPPAAEWFFEVLHPKEIDEDEEEDEEEED